MNDRNHLLRRLPAVDRLLNDPALQDLCGHLPHLLLGETAREVVADLRQQILRGDSPNLNVSIVAEQVAEKAQNKNTPSLRPVINATGTLLHTNLGRSPLGTPSLEAVATVAAGYSNLEYDLNTGDRGNRHSHVEKWLCRLTGAEAAMVVNNNAAAVLLCIAALAKGKEAIVSRGELVEIGGSFRIPEVMEAGGARLREVGTTNRTRLEDYRQAIGEETGLLLKVHTSNYRIVGFTETVFAAELVALAREKDLPVVEDLGSGLLIDLAEFGLPREPTVSETVAAGVDVVTFSGDKLLGGPQGGLIVGRREIVEQIRRHPLSRALRSDKLTLAALEATLRLYADRETALREIPVLRMLALSAGTLQKRCDQLVSRLRPLLSKDFTVEVVPEASTVGGGALPTAELPGFVVALSANCFSAEEMAACLRATAPPVIARIREERLLLDLRTVSEEEESQLFEALQQAFAESAG